MPSPSTQRSAPCFKTSPSRASFTRNVDPSGRATSTDGPPPSASPRLIRASINKSAPRRLYDAWGASRSSNWTTASPARALTTSPSPAPGASLTRHLTPCSSATDSVRPVKQSSSDTVMAKRRGWGRPKPPMPPNASPKALPKPPNICSNICWAWALFPPCEKPAKGLPCGMPPGPSTPALPKRSYCFLFAGSLRTSRASLSFLNSSGSPPLSGWHRSDFRL
mmetsp:Transcript_13910/g.36955  ORF Transcript_13910/g.36955 Transcript_13910/m.36955 type:complete len:222 (+) Transcript_13910:275-940(+)